MRTRLGVLAIALLATAPVTAVAQPRAISGKLDRAGYTVVAVAADGTATSVRAAGGSFRLTPPATNVTLHLRAPDGKYAGPVVVARSGKHAITGVRAGARLGRIAVRPAKGYAKAARRPAKRRIDERRWARARSGVPIGAGKYGRVRSAPPRKAPPGDRDADGVANTLDVDIDGDRILNNQDRSTRARAAQAGEIGVRSLLGLTANTVVNANAHDRETQQPLSVAEIDAAMREHGVLLLDSPDGGPLLDCGAGRAGAGLIYCTPGGTGRVYKGDGECCTPRTAWLRFPDDYLDAATGLGRIPDTPGGGFFLSHGAGSAEVGTGDMLIVRTATGDLTATIEYVFATVPAVAAYGDTATHGGDIRYPVAQGEPGTMGTGLPVGAPQGEDVVLTLTLWRPQRTAVSEWGETGAWTDIGGLTYVPIAQAMRGPDDVNVAIAGPDRGACPQTTLSIPDDQPLEPVAFPVPGNAGPAGAGALTDTAGHAASSPDNRFSFRVNVTQCLASMGITWAVGDELDLTFKAIPGPGTLDEASMGLTFERVG